MIELAEQIQGIRGVNGGPLANSRYVEGITALLVQHQPHLQGARPHVRIVGDLEPRHSTHGRLREHSPASKAFPRIQAGDDLGRIDRRARSPRAGR